MLRVIGLPAMLITLFVGAYLSMKDMQKNGPTSPAGQQEIAQAHSATAGLNFNQAVPGLQAYYDENHTYVGATLPPGSERHPRRRRPDLVLPAGRERARGRPRRHGSARPLLAQPSTGCERRQSGER